MGDENENVSLIPHASSLIPESVLLQRPIKRRLEIDAGAVGKTEQDEEGIAHLAGKLGGGFVGLDALRTVHLVDRPRDLADFLGQPRQVR